MPAPIRVTVHTTGAALIAPFATVTLKASCTLIVLNVVKFGVAVMAEAWIEWFSDDGEHAYRADLTGKTYPMPVLEATLSAGEWVIPLSNERN